MKKMICMLVCIALCLGSLVYAEDIAVMYAPDGRSVAVAATDVAAWRNVGWYDMPVTALYAPDGRAIVVATSDVPAWELVGWFQNLTVTMYAPDGRAASVFRSDVQAWKNVGWYEVPVTTVYAPDGRTEVIAVSDVPAWEQVGWFRTTDAAQAAQQPVFTQSANESNYTGTVYRTPTGTKYHFDPECGGKNSRVTSLDAAKSAGLEPCQKCAH